MAKPISAEQIEEDTKLQNSLSKIKHVVIVLSGKGGVGKSTVASNLAETLAMDGYQTGIMDLDITGPNIPKMFHVEDARLTVEQDKLIPVMVPPSLKLMSMAFLLPDKDSAVLWRGPVKMGAVRQFIEDVNWGELDFLVIDMPPGTGDEALSIAQLIPKADGAVIVTTPQDVSLLDSRKSVTFAAEVHIPVIGLIENMSGFVCPKCGEVTDIFKSGGGEATAKDMNIQFLGKVPLEAGVVSSGDEGMPIVLRDPKSKSAEAFEAIAAKIVKTVESDTATRLKDPTEKEGKQ
ncbi:MAG: Mrp/NBP35 family ATP-binding protein [Candidatus Methanomethylophilus sp.]|nr:Mrp/NBP35 family ATP-binding protein [Methanomethylophilus sp.]MDD3233427.1 Mrp/NBP35 family ATP-binding protein [Methanomethylophilus sp.]MDD4221692.1 Mrp/NBP35 family ATP-binding protein [Methanomethylophilus sp.]MDD4668264.1 Mrp/NBP35 family ATP-binding protein [Methanomethylophilus sp.]